MEMAKSFNYKTAVKAINKVIRPYITKEIFPKYYSERKKKLWVKRPVQSIIELDKNEVRYKSQMNSKARTNSIVCRLLLKIRGENYMEKVEHELRNEHNSLTEEIKRRAEELAKEDKARKRLMERSKENGWIGLTIDEIDFDLNMMYGKVMEQLKEVKYVGRSELALVNFLRDIKKDKMDMVKFMAVMEHKQKELEARAQHTKKGGTFQQFYQGVTPENKSVRLDK